VSVSCWLALQRLPATSAFPSTEEKLAATLRHLFLPRGPPTSSHHSHSHLATKSGFLPNLTVGAGAQNTPNRYSNFGIAHHSTSHCRWSDHDFIFLSETCVFIL